MKQATAPVLTPLPASDPVPARDHRQVVLALRDLLIAADKHNTGDDPELASAYHQARLVLAKNTEHLR